MSAYKEFSHFIKAIGAGKRAGRYLSEHEAYTAMRMILANQVKPEQKGAFLMLLRVREESIEELSGFVRACREFLPAHNISNFGTDKNSAADIDVACYAGKRRQLPWFILAMSVLQQNGYRLFMHGTSEPESNRLYLRDALCELGLLDNIIANTESEALEKLNNQGITYMDLANFHPALNSIIQLRELFGLRSCANTLARLLNPFNAKYCVQGVHHHGVDEKHVNIAARLQNENIVCFRGEGGEVEINPAKETTLQFYQNSSLPNIKQYQMPAKQNWQIKPKTLDTNLLLAFWQNDRKHEGQNEDTASLNQINQLNQIHGYAYNTIISTLTPIIMMTQNANMQEASEKATQWWRSRDKDTFMSVGIHNKVHQDIN